MSRAHNELAEATENDLKRLRDQQDKTEVTESHKKRRRNCSSTSSSEEEIDSDEETIGSSTTTSSSSESEDMDERDARMELAVKQDDFLEAWFEDRLPVSFDEEVDIFLVDTAEVLPEDAPVVPERYKAYERELYAYDTGVTVIKRYGPWGPASALRSEGFVVKKKIYSPSGEIRFVQLKNLYDAQQTVQVGPALFAGWVDEYASNFL